VQVLVEDEDARRNKAAMLLELLLDTARPSLLEARRLRADTAASPLERLLRLIRFDVTLLASGESNVGSLYLLPEVAGPEFTEFHRIRAELIEVYQALLAETVAAGQAEIASVPRTTALLFSIVEGVILRRADDPTLPAATSKRQRSASSGRGVLDASQTSVALNEPPRARRGSWPPTAPTPGHGPATPRRRRQPGRRDG
jgi:AcrR family transcriptional regulator